MVVSESTARRYELQDPDVRLMLQVRDGSAAAFDELMTRYQSRLVTVLEHLTGRRDLAEDLAQEVFLRVYRARQRYVPGAKFSTWLFTIANNVASNALRTLARRPEVQVPPRDPNAERQPIRSTTWRWRPVVCCRPGSSTRPNCKTWCEQALARAQPAAADGGAAEQVRRDELRRHCRDDADEPAGGQVAAGPGARQPARGARAVSEKLVTCAAARAPAESGRHGKPPTTTN